MNPAPQATPSYPALGVAAKAIVRRDDGAILLIRRSPGSSTDPNCWDLPGGKMDYGEQLADALVREVREETGLTVDRIRPFHVCHFTAGPLWVTCVTFVCSPGTGEIRLSDEHVAHDWAMPNELDDRPYGRAIKQQIEAFLAIANDPGSRS